MKKIISLILLLACTQLTLAQAKIYSDKEVDNQPYFPGGWNEWITFVEKNMKWIPEKKGAQNIQIEFTVQANGVITDVEVINQKPNVNEKEALRVMTLSPKWIPATLAGKKVACRLNNYGMFNPWFDNEPILTVAPIHHTSNRITPVINEDDNLVYSTAGIEVKPNFPEGIEKFYEFFNNNFQMPEESLKGKVYATFIIEKDGSLSDIKILRDIGYGTGKETIRVLKLSPKWNPGVQNGKTVRVMYSMPFPIGQIK
jgi:hypothetical protein